MFRQRGREIIFFGCGETTRQHSLTNLLFDGSRDIPAERRTALPQVFFQICSGLALTAAKAYASFANCTNVSKAH